MRRGLAIAAFGAAALAFAADDPNAPLANAKAQLQSLKKDETARKADTPGGVKLELPALTTPSTELELPRPKRDDAEAKDKKRNAQKDWLLEGFDKLDRKKSSATSQRSAGKAGDDEKPLDPNDPDYFLRVYERQRAERDAKQLAVDAPDAGELRSSTADPFAPFMKEWLANSPVRDALREANPGGSTSEAVARPTGNEPAPQTVTGDLVTPAPGAPRGSGTNPFVQALGLGAVDAPKPAETRAPTVDLYRGAGFPPPPSGASGNTIYDLPERPKADVKHALPPPPSDDKKYFPQLKKF